MNLTEAKKQGRQALITLYNYQEIDEQMSNTTVHKNGAGFSYSDSEFLSSLALKAIDIENSNRDYLSDKQYTYLFKAVKKYHRQLSNYSELIEWVKGQDLSEIESALITDREVKRAEYLKAQEAKKTAAEVKKPSLVLSYKNDVFTFTCDFNNKDIAKGAGFKWNAADKKWQTSDISIAKKLTEYADDSANQAFSAIEAKKVESFKKSSASESSLNIPVPAGLEYLPFQRAGIEYAIGRKHTLVADEMGLGKTIQAIGTCNYKKPETVLIICPASLKLNWKKEWDKWNTLNIQAVILDGKALSPVNIINYDQLKKYNELLTSITWDVIIYDESQYLKNSKAIRTQLGLGIKGNQKLYLTGTPILNRPIELYPILKNAGVGIAKNWRDFVTTYCDGQNTKWGWDVSGASNTEELGRILREEFMVRRLKKDVLKELPEKRVQALSLPVAGNKALINKEIEAKKMLDTAMAEIKARIKALKESGKQDTQEYKDAIQSMRATFADFTEIAKIRHEVALSKVSQAVEIITDMVESSGQIVVFAHHTDVIDNLISGLKDNKISCAKITGSTPIEERNKIVENFQAGKIQVFVGSMKACGTGLTLTASSNVVFLELDWTPSTISQAEDRTHRIGQEQSVNVFYLIYDGTIDAHLAQCMINKQDVIESILDI